MEKDQVLVFEKNKSPASFFKPPIISFASGKGGVGRSFMVSSLGITLAKMGLRVVVIDFDFTGANLHSWFGQHPLNPNVGDYFKNPKLKLKELLNPTNIEELKIIHGFWPTWGIFNINAQYMAQFLEEMKNL
jgi:flagellar biosynthesis protein FlhG